MIIVILDKIKIFFSNKIIDINNKEFFWNNHREYVWIQIILYNDKT